jgi:hypothetical protein
MPGQVLFERPGFHAVEFRQMEIEHHFLIAEDHDALFGLEGEGVPGHSGAGIVKIEC